MKRKNLLGEDDEVLGEIPIRHEPHVIPLQPADRPSLHFHQDVASRPKEASLDDYEQVPVGKQNIAS